MKNYALITGASKGIGLELAKLFAKDGYNLIIVARSREILEKIKLEFEERYHIIVKVIAKDLTNVISAKELFEEVKKCNLKVDYLINNAGFGDYGEFLDADINHHINMINLNIISLMQLCSYFGNEMKKNGFGKIMNLGSIASFFPGPLMATYYATKAFVLSFSEALSRELKNSGVSITVLCPGTTDTNFFNNANATSDKTNLLKKMHPATPESVARYGYNKMMKNQVVAIHSIKNRTAIFMNRFISRKFSRNIVYNIQKKRK